MPLNFSARAPTRSMACVGYCVSPAPPFGRQRCPGNLSARNGLRWRQDACADRGRISPFAQENNAGQFPIVITIDSSKLWDAFVELIHPTRDEREGDRIITDRIQLADRADVRRPTLVVSVPDDRPPYHKTLTTEWWLAFLEPPSLRPRICLPARRSIWSASAKGCYAKSPAWRGRLGNLERSAPKAEMDALANIRA